MTIHQGILALATCCVIGAPVALAAQSLEQRVAAVKEGQAQFHFAARPGVCGNGRTFFRVDDDSWYGSWNSGSYDAGPRAESCEAGPVRVVVTRAGGDIVKIETYAGTLVSDAGDGRDLGVVPAREAAAYLLSLAATIEGRPAREALLPAMLADSASVTSALLGLVRNQALSRDVRRSAITWLARRRGEPGGVGARGVAEALDALVRDRNEGEGLRQAAMNSVAQMNRGEGIPALVGFASDKDPWIARQALQTLARSGDPRARTFVRDAVRRPELSDEVRSEMIRGLGGDYASGSDYKALRDLYPAMTTDRERDAIISVLSQAGGGDNVSWLVTLARSPTETVARRRRVLTALARSDDPRVKALLTELLEKR